MLWVPPVHRNEHDRSASSYPKSTAAGSENVTKTLLGPRSLVVFLLGPTREEATRADVNANAWGAFLSASNLPHDTYSLVAYLVARWFGDVESHSQTDGTKAAVTVCHVQFGARVLRTLNSAYLFNCNPSIERT